MSKDFPLTNSADPDITKKETVTDPETETIAESEPEVEPIMESIPQKTESPIDNSSTESDYISADSTAPKPYHERYYLKYVSGKRTFPLDLNGTKALLQNLGFDGGELRQARKGKDCSEEYSSADANKTGRTICSYCGTDISGVDFYRLPDGRVRCTSCSNSLVTTKNDAETLFNRVLNNMEGFFGATIDVPVSISLMDELKLKRKLGLPLGTQDGMSLLVLGVAINKNKKYSIILENGAPRISLIATFAHELTHIWQYTHWTNKKAEKKLSKKNRLILYEGMAKWAEIQYLYLLGESAVAKREEERTRARNDEYGIGFCIYEDRFPISRKAMTCNETPFTAAQLTIE